MDNHGADLTYFDPFRHHLSKVTASVGKNNDIVDVLVIGAGPSGAAFTWSLSEAGIDVLCLEQGDWPDKAAYPQLSDDHEVRRQSEWHPDPNVRGLPQDYPINVDDSDIYPLMHNAVGGSSIHWGAHFPRLHPSDFRMKTLDGVGVDWPVSYGEIEPFFDLNDRMLGIAGLAGDTAYPPKSPRQMPPLPLGVLGETMAKGFDRLGWHWWPSDSAINTTEYDGREACKLRRPLRARVHPRRQGHGRCHLLAQGAGQRGQAHHRGPSPRDYPGPRRSGVRRRLPRRRGAPCASSEPATS